MALKSISLGPTLALKEFTINNDPSNPTLVEICGRPPGFTGWLLSTMGLDNRWRLTVSQSSVAFRRVSAEGETVSLLPLQNVASTHCGHQKPIAYLILAALFAVFAPVSFGLTLIVSVILVVMYFTQKSMSISVESVGGMTLGLQFKPNIIEGVKVDIATVSRAIDTINRELVRVHGGLPDAPGLLVPASLATPPAVHNIPLPPPMASALFCAQCGAKVTAGERHCHACGAAQG